MEGREVVFLVPAARWQLVAGRSRTGCSGVEVVNGAGPAHGKEASEGVCRRKGQVVWLGVGSVAVAPC